MIDVVIPMAGAGKRFADAGYAKPKPLVDVAGRPMIQRVIDSLTPSDEEAQFFLVATLTDDLPGVVVELTTPTQGAVETLLHAALYVQDRPVIVANCDQWLAAGVIDRFLAACAGWDAAVITFESTNPHHSFVRLDGDRITEVAEKRVISDDAIVGVYWFADSAVLFDYCRKVMANNLRHEQNNEFYLSAALDLMVKDGLRMRAFPIEGREKGMLGTPEELEAFLAKVTDGRVNL